MTRPHALLRIGFSYNRTIGMRRLTNTPIDIVVTKDGLVRTLCRQGKNGFVRTLNMEDEDLGAFNIGASGVARQIGGGKSVGGFTWPSGMTTDAEENLWISDEGTHKISKMSLEGEMLDQWGEHGSETGELNRPSGISFDPEGNLWVADSFNHRVQKFDPSGAHLLSVGSLGDGPGELNMPWGLHVDELGSVYVSDWRNDRLQIFSPEGDLISQIGESGSGEGQFNRPAGVTVDKDGDIYVVDRGNNRVQLFGPDGSFVEQFIGDATLGNQAYNYMVTQVTALRLREMASIEQQKRLRDPIAVLTDNEGYMYVTDYGSHRIQIYKKEAHVLEAHEISDPLRSPSLYTQF